MYRYRQPHDDANVDVHITTKKKRAMPMSNILPHLIYVKNVQERFREEHTQQIFLPLPCIDLLNYIHSSVCSSRHNSYCTT